MAIIGAHSLLYTSEPEALRAVFRDVLKLPFVDAHDGWLIFKLPPGEIGVHPSKDSVHHEFSLMCDDLGATLADLRGKPGITIAQEPEDHGYGIVAYLGLPGGVKVQLYQPRHPLAISL